jgi:RHS repeat-associated protein
MRTAILRIAVLGVLGSGPIPASAQRAGPCPSTDILSSSDPVVITEDLLDPRKRPGAGAVECLYAPDGRVRAAFYPPTPYAPNAQVRLFRTGGVGSFWDQSPIDTIPVLRGTGFLDLDPETLRRVQAAAGVRVPNPVAPAGGLHPPDERESPAALLRASYSPTTPSTRSPSTRSISRTYDALDRLISETVPLQDGTTATLTYTYWRNGQRKTLTDALGRVTFYEYDGRNRLSRLTVNQGLPDQQVTTYEYWPDSLPKTVTKPDGTVASYEYDQADRLLSVVVRKDGAELLSYGYTYDGNGNRTSQVERNGGSSETTMYTYDGLDRLATVKYPDDRVVIYSYDAVGNRTSETERDPSGIVVSQKVAVFDRTNRLSTVTDAVNPANNATFTYDRNGNLTGRTTPTGTTTYAYDIRDQLVETQAGDQISGRFAYDAFGRRYLKIGNEGVRQYLYDQTSLLQEFMEHGVEVAKYEWGADRLASFVRQNGPRLYYHFDGLGSIAALTDGTGTVAARYHYDAWGGYRDPAEVDANPNRFGFTGHYFDTETKLYFAKARYYDAAYGRFTIQDSYLGAISDPPSLHRYLYAHGNPARFVDPTGHNSEEANPREPSLAEALQQYRAAQAAQKAAEQKKPTAWETLRERGEAFVRWGASFFVSEDGPGSGVPTDSPETHVAANRSPADDVAAQVAALEERTRQTLEAGATVGRVGGTIGRETISLAGGTVTDAYAAATGVDAGTEEQLETGDRLLAAGAVLIPGVGGRELRLGTKAVDLADDALKPGGSAGRSVYNARTSPGITQAVLEGINPRALNAEARFGRAVYVAEQGTTAVGEVLHHGNSATHVIRYELDVSAAKVLDLTDPTQAGVWGYTGGEKYAGSQAIAHKAKELGYDVIKYKSLRGEGDNYAVLGNFDALLRPQMVVPVPSR